MSAAQRKREFVIRVALGATSARVLRLLARDQLGAVVAGIAAGVVISFWATEALSTHLYGVTPREPAIWIAAAVMMLVVAALGATIPCARAARVDPAQALRVE
jgi:ABC-type antimicrobial peptide transport system permease subunit